MFHFIVDANTLHVLSGVESGQTNGRLKRPFIVQDMAVTSVDYKYVFIRSLVFKNPQILGLFISLFVIVNSVASPLVGALSIWQEISR